MLEPTREPGNAATHDTAATHNTVVWSVRDGIAHVEIDRAEKLNSLTRKVFADLVEVGLRLREAAEVRAVVLSGRGRAFSAGLDFWEFSVLAEAGPGGPDGDAEAARPLGAARALAQKAVHVWSLVPVPVIAAVNGAALGGGMQIALGADLRIAHPESQFSMMEIKWGIIPDMCGTQLLPRLVGPAQAKKLIFTGTAVGGEEALRIGLIEELAEDPVRRALDLAAELTDRSRSALVWAKSLVDGADHLSLEEGLAAEQEALGQLAGTAEQKAAMEAQLARLLKK